MPSVLSPLANEFLSAVLRTQIIGEAGRPLIQFGLSLSLAGTPLKLAIGALQGGRIPTEGGSVYVLDATDLEP
jgi:hypothetical protein